MISQTKKQQIAEKLKAYCKQKGSQNKAANSLKGVSSATITQISKGKWELIADEMWRNIASQIGYSDKKWVSIQTRDFKIVSQILADAQENSLVMAITGEAGTGKTFALKTYAENNQNVFLLNCSEYWNRKMFLQELLTAMGRDSSGYTVGEMMHEAVKVLKTIDLPIIIMDEFDKVSDQVQYFFITLFNNLEDHCAIVLCATDHLAKRIQRGLKLNKKGYKEIYSRIGRKFIELKGISSTDITQICMANGVTEHADIRQVIEDCENDLRRVKRKIHAIRKSSK